MSDRARERESGRIENRAFTERRTELPVMHRATSERQSREIEQQKARESQRKRQSVIEHQTIGK